MKVITSKSKLACQQIHYGVAVWTLDYSPCTPGWFIQTPPPPPHLTLKSVMKLKIDRKYKKCSENPSPSRNRIQDLPDTGRTLQPLIFWQLTWRAGRRFWGSLRTLHLASTVA